MRGEIPASLENQGLRGFFNWRWVPFWYRIFILLLFPQLFLCFFAQSIMALEKVGLLEIFFPKITFDGNIKSNRVPVLLLSSAKWSYISCYLNSLA